uniref:EOG090X02SD n=1 Tax=Daphnia dolichocephala TaxID=2282166 RepID=A0A4Y7M5C8_9CRUS|nr:EOG090X02SD [Daphnia dolichocephala]
MNLLPKSSSEFSQQDYWDKFFKTRGKKAFEWYGTYQQLYSILHKYINPRDNILVGGCGNSALSADLYNAGFTSMTNVDISETVIGQMTKQYEKSHPLMKFVAMDLLQMTFEADTFSCFLDKGTLDALMSDTNQESLERAEKMFKEIDRVLKIGGRYICISLLQEHILHCLISYFKNLGWMIRVCRCEEAERQEDPTDLKQNKQSGSSRFPFPVFAVVCTKFKKMERMTPLLEFCPDEKSTERLSSVEQLKERVRSIQHFATLCHQMSHDETASRDVFIELMDPKSLKDTPKYILFIVDRQCKSNQKFAAFVVPQGRETDWLFASAEGRRQLADSAKFQRLIVVHLGRDHKFDTLDSVQTELAGIVSSLQPQGLPPNTQIPFLSLGAQVNQRKEIHRAASDSTGEYVIEEVEEEDDGKPVILRRLIFLSNPNVIQSEARLKNGKVDLKYLACQHHLVMVEELREYLGIQNTGPKSILVIGLGGGALCTYLHRVYPQFKIDGVEIDPTMVELAKQYFGFKPNENLRPHIADGLSFVQQLAASESSDRYGCIMLDVDCKDRSLGISCPPPSFLDPSFIESVKQCLSPYGFLLMNLVCRDEVRRKAIMEMLHESFAIVQGRKIKGEVNEIIRCHPQALTASSKAKDSAKKSSKN